MGGREGEKAKLRLLWDVDTLWDARSPRGSPGAEQTVLLVLYRSPQPTLPERFPPRPSSPPRRLPPLLPLLKPLLPRPPATLSPPLSLCPCGRDAACPISTG
jgi:hypothetical protein